MKQKVNYCSNCKHLRSNLEIHFCSHPDVLGSLCEDVRKGQWCDLYSEDTLTPTK